MVKETKIKKGYKQTEIGVIPEDWDVKECRELGSFYKGRGISSKDLVADGLPCIMYGDIYVKFSTKFSNPDFRIAKHTAAKSSVAKTGDLFFTGSGETADEIGKCVVYQGSNNIYVGGDIIVFSPNINNKSLFLAYMQNSKMLLSQKANLGQGYTVVHIYTEQIKSLKMPIPPTKVEQTAIADVLSDTDALIEGLEKLIAKKKAIKQGAMQELLTGKKRLPGFSGAWETKTLLETTICLDNLRVPLNDSQRKKMTGNYPYCGANGILDFINRYMIDEDIILIAEDGGYFDEFTYRPIAYRIRGKCWVNNHAHILKAKESFSQDFIFYSLVHKNILSFLTSGTRAKLNKSEMYKIEIVIPPTKSEQTAIATILSDMDAEIEKLEERKDKYVMLKQGMMQVLLTGKVRLI
jgi:type I restriction enzyme S subunit